MAGGQRAKVETHLWRSQRAGLLRRCPVGEARIRVEVGFCGEDV